MKISVCCNVQYWYDVEVDSEVNVKDQDDLLDYADTNDPVYRTLCGVLTDANLDYEGNIVSILNEKGECIFTY